MPNVKQHLRDILAESHISAIAISILLLWSLSSAFLALGQPFVALADYLVTAVAIVGIPSSGPITLGDKVMLFITGQYLLSASMSFAAACVLSRWAYGTGPFRSLSQFRNAILRNGNHA